MMKKRKMRIDDSDSDSEKKKLDEQQNKENPPPLQTLPEEDIAKNYREDINNFVQNTTEVKIEDPVENDKVVKKEGEGVNNNDIEKNIKKEINVENMEQVTEDEREREGPAILAVLPLKDLPPLKLEKKVKQEKVKEEDEKKTPRNRESAERKRKRPADDDDEYEETKEDSSPKKKVRSSTRKNTTSTQKTPKKEIKSESEEETDTKRKPATTPKKREDTKKTTTTTTTTPKKISTTPTSKKRKVEETEKKETPKQSKRRSSSKPKKEDDEEEDEEEESEKKTPKTPKKEKKTPKNESSKKKKTSPTENDNNNSSSKKRKTEKKEEEAEARKWWEENEEWRVGKKQHWKWRTLEHSGVYFTPPYQPHGVKLIYDGNEVDLTPEQEEWATYFVRYLDSDHMKKEQFSRNFFSAWRELLGKKHVVKEFEKCDFGLILKHVKIEQEKRKNRTREEKLLEKKEKALLKEKHGYAIVDGHKEAIANFTVEPPGLFLGRGQHPKAGMFKQRVMPEQVTLNLTEGSDPPPCPVPGHNWGAIVHNHEVTWLACWRENINNQNKYVLFSAQSSIRGRSDHQKFETARRLKEFIKKIRKDYMKNLKNKEDPAIRQRATAMWVIDRLALRVGNDKGKDEADTVGCCSLRVEHVKLHDDYKIELDFLGKDSMRYHNTVQVIPEVYKNFQLFMKGKSDDEQVFDRLNPPQLNAHLQSLMDGLTAKVFRTYNASFTMQQELAKFNDENATVEEKVLFFNSASVQVAILCNHQRTVSKTHSAQMGKIDEQVKEAQEEIKELKAHIKRVKAGKEPKKRKSTEDGEEKKPFSTNPDVCERRIKGLQEKIRKLNIKKKEKDTLKEVSTSTSKVNYIDPRISIAWCMKNGVDIKKIFAKTMRDKFAWAIAEVNKDPDFVF